MERQDHDSRYSEPWYYDSVHKIWVNGQYEQVELPSTQRPLHGGECGFDHPTDSDGMDEERTKEVNQNIYFVNN